MSARIGYLWVSVRLAVTAPVIVGVDGGESGRDALVLGRWAASVLDAPLVVAVVHPAPSALGSGRIDAEWVADRHRAAEQVLDGARTVLSSSKSEIEYRMVASSSAAHGLHDLAEEVADFMGLYRIEAATEQAIALAMVLEQAGSELARALTRLRRPPDLRPHIVALDELEHEGDRLERAALSSLFDGGIDPMVVIRWKDIYERLEAAIDACRHAGNTLESLIVKSS